MKPLNIIAHLKEQLSAESRQATLDTIISNQIQVIEKIIESNGSFVKDPGAYNSVSGLLDQLKYLTPAIFKTVEENKQFLENSLLDGKPQFGYQPIHYHPE